MKASQAKRRANTHQKKISVWNVWKMFGKCSIQRMETSKSTQYEFHVRHSGSSSFVSSFLSSPRSNFLFLFHIHSKIGSELREGWPFLGKSCNQGKNNNSDSFRKQQHQQQMQKDTGGEYKAQMHTKFCLALTCKSYKIQERNVLQHTYRVLCGSSTQHTEHTVHRAQRDKQFLISISV